jgi:hypothetical protein
MRPLERRGRWLLRAYPAWYRRERGEEMVATLLEASGPGRRWPSARDTRALLMGGLRVRATRNQRLTTAASLRQAVQLGAALVLLWLVAINLTSDILSWAHVYASNSGTGHWFAYGVLGLAAVAAAWFAPRPVVVALALAAAAAWEYWSVRVIATLPAVLLITLAILVCRAERMPRSWLWLAGGSFAVDLLQGFTPVPPLYFLYQPLGFVLWIILGIVVVWAVVDARLAMAMTVYLVCIYPVSILLTYASYGGWPGVPWQWYLPLSGVAVLAGGSLWRLRRQAVL